VATLMNDTQILLGKLATETGMHRSILGGHQAAS